MGAACKNLTIISLCDNSAAINLEEYKAQAIAIGRRRALAKKQQQQVREQRLSTPLFDTKRWVRDWERILYGIWDAFTADSAARFHIVLLMGSVVH